MCTYYLFLNQLFYFLCMYVPKCTVEHHHIHASDSLELGLQMAVNCAVGAGSQT